MKAVISDIHANLSAISAVLEDIEKLGTVEEIICLGDIIGYGPSPCECLDLIATRMASLMGNHEDIFLDFLKGGDIRPLLINGGTSTLTSYELDKRREGDPLIPPEHLEFFENLLSWIELDDYYVVHAGCAVRVSVFWPVTNAIA